MSAGQATPHTAAVLVIGAEVLSAKVHDENSPYLLQALRAQGIDVVEVRTIADQESRIATAVRELAENVAYVFTTGGIGPTHDDVTFAGVAQAFGLRLVRHAEIEQRIQSYFGSATSSVHLKMADVPETASVVFDGDRLVPIVRVRNVTIFPGVPAFVKTCFARIAAELVGQNFVSRHLLLSVSELHIATVLTDIQRQFPQVAVGSYPRFDQAPYRVKVTFDGRSKTDVHAAFNRLLAALPSEWIVTSAS